ncbi:hypothetical protein HN51_053721 [Arachis hypogaea]
MKGADIRGIQEVYIDARNLENLCYHALDMDAPFKLILDSCTNLRWLSLQNLRSPNKWFLEQFYRIPFLESLMLHNCSMFEHERINIPSPELKFFSLSHCYNLKEVNIDAPNLLSCEYDGKGNPVISFLRISNQLELNAHYGVIMNHRHVYSLREFVQNIKPHKVLGEFVQNIKPQKVLASLSLFIHEPYSFFYEMLMDRKKCGCYLRSRSKQCCWHGLKVVKVTHLERTCENVEDLKAMLDALPESLLRN